MNKKIAVIIIVQAALIIGLFWALVFYGKDKYVAETGERGDEIKSPPQGKAEAGDLTVTLSAQTQAQSGISTGTLKAGSHQTVLAAYGSVVGIDTLIDLRTRYLTAKADASVVRASLSNSQQDYQRLLLLNQDNHNISDRAVLAAQAVLKADEARLAAAETLAGSVRDNMRQQWGETLAALATTQPASPILQRLLQYREVLLQVTLPFDSPTPKPGNRLAVTPTGGAPGKPVPAEFVSASAQTDATIQGKTYYYRAAADDLRVGMRVSVRMTDSTKTVNGVIVPNSAVIWYGGKAWVYRKQGTEQFVRVPIRTDTEVNDGWFNVGNIQAGDEVVTSGAQLLLSEEFKSQTKTSNEESD